jgi:hypothetical protein
LNGVFKTDDMEVKYRLRFIQNNHVWKMLGLNVDATRKKQWPSFIIASDPSTLAARATPGRSPAKPLLRAAGSEAIHPSACGLWIASSWSLSSGRPNRAGPVGSSQ